MSGFQEQLEIVQGEIDDILKLGAPPSTLYNRPLLSRLQEAAFLCLHHRQLALAIDFFLKILQHLDAKPPRRVRNKLLWNDQSKQEDEKKLLQRQTLNNLGAVYHQMGDMRRAMALYHQSNQVVATQSNPTIDTSASPSTNSILSDTSSTNTVHHEEAQTYVAILAQLNYALVLHASGDYPAAALAAEWVLDQLQIKSQQKEQPEQLQQEQQNEKKQFQDRAVETEISALSVLSSCARHENNLQLAIDLATQACEKVDVAPSEIVPCALAARCHNNLGIYLFEQRVFPDAMNHFLLALRAAQQASDLSQQAVTKYHMGLTLCQLEVTVETQWNPEGLASWYNAPANMELLSAKEYLRQAEELSKNDQVNDPVLGLVCKSCVGEMEYNRGGFHTAEAEFSIALLELNQLTNSLNVATDDANHDQDFLGTSNNKTNNAMMVKELELLHGRLQSFLGSTHLIEGKFDLALAAHQSDFDLAIKQQDIYSQLRALRNMALVHNTTSHFELALPLWQQSIQLATSLQNPRELMLAYSGLGLALRECELAEPTDQIRAELSKYQAPLEVFLRHRALAIELQDRQQQILAQRCVVSIYELLESRQQQLQQVESIVIQQQQMEHRLAECDTLVKLCKQCGTLQQLSDSYRLLATALTSQVARLQKRGKRFAEAARVLAEKRDNVAALYKKTCADIIDIAQTGDGNDVDEELACTRPADNLAQLLIR